MPTVFDLINSENFAQVIFITSSLLAISSGIQGKQTELKKQHGAPPAEIQSATINITEIVIISILLSICSYLIFLKTAIIRKDQLQQEIQSSTSNASIEPNIIIIIGFIFSLVGALLRLMVAKQRLEEARLPVSLL